MCSCCVSGAGPRVLVGCGGEAQFVLDDDAPMGEVPVVVPEVVGTDRPGKSFAVREDGVLALESAG